MNAIIWWLESPWQLRALVFILSFFVCFVGPWLHSQSLLTSRIAARKSLEETSEAASAPKAESLLQQTDTQAKVHAPEEHVSVHEKTSVQAAPAPAEVTKTPAQEKQASTPQGLVEAPAPVEPKAPAEQATSQEKPPVQAAPAPAEVIKAPVREEQASAPQGLVEAPAPVEPKAPAEHATAQEKAPVQEVAISEAATKTGGEPDQVMPPTQEPHQAASAPAKEEPAAPGKQEQAAVQASAQPALQQIAGGFSFVKESADVIPTPAGSVLEKQDFVVSTAKGGSAEVEVHALPIKAGLGLRRPGRVADQTSSRTDLSALLDSNALGEAVARYDTVICVGLGSRRAPLSSREITRLIDNRAVQLCGIIARKPYVSENAKFYGLPLGRQLDAAPTERDRAERTMFLIGIRNAKGDLTDAAVQKKMIAEFVREGKIADFPLGNVSEIAAGKELRYIEVKGGTVPYKGKPVKSSAIKPGYSTQREGLQLNRARIPLVRKRCSAGIAARVAPSARRKISISTKATAETSTRPTHRGCGIFDFPF